jgi:hypothetical protein
LLVKADGAGLAMVREPACRTALSHSTSFSPLGGAIHAIFTFLVDLYIAGSPDF